MTDIKKLKNLCSVSLVFSLISILFSGCGKSQPQSTQALLNNAFQSANHGEWKQALDKLEIVTEREPDNANALIFTAIAYDGNGKPELALNTARRAAKIAPDSFFAQYTLGWLYAKDPQKMQDAVTPLLRALQIKPNDSNTLLLLGRCSSALKLDSAIKYYKKLANNKKFSKRAELWNEMGVYYAERKQTREAAVCFVKAYKLAPLKPIMVLNFATFRDYYVGDPKGALGFYKKYLRVAVPSPASERQRQRVETRIKQIAGNNK